MNQEAKEALATQEAAAKVRRTAFIKRYATLADAGQWDELVDFIRTNVNDSKDVLISVDPAVHRELHTALKG